MTTSLKNFEPFFGDDQKGPFLVQALFNGTNYTDREGFRSGLLTELLRSENYKNNQYQNPNDIPPDITDLIITTGLFHRSIDKSSTAGTNISSVLDRIPETLRNFMNMDISKLNIN